MNDDGCGGFENEKAGNGFPPETKRWERRQVTCDTVKRSYKSVNIIFQSVTAATPVGLTKIIVTAKKKFVE